MFQDSFNGGVDFQVGARTAIGVHYVHNNLGAPSRTSARWSTATAST
jgi:hypothetical protein